MQKALLRALEQKHGNHIFPFFWQHQEDDETLLRELHAIYDSGIRAVTLESRPAPDFAKEPWFADMRLIMDECRKLGMECWILDDKHFPSGFANMLMREKYPHLCKHGLAECHMDVCGPLTDGAVALDFRRPENGELVGIVACERHPDSGNQRMTGKAFDLTDCYHDGLVWLDIPEGLYRIFAIYDVPDTKDAHVDCLREDSVALMLEAVYEPHFAALGDYFGNTFRGFFSDEPYISYAGNMAIGNGCAEGAVLPYNANVRAALEAADPAWLTRLPGLWYPCDGIADFRIAYMDIVSNLYAKCFTKQLADWCHAHGVEYIGHIVEDNNAHTTVCAAGHFFRALEAQDMAGVDVVLNQIVPGMGHNSIAVPCNYQTADHAFFHYALAKLGASQAHLQPTKKGRAMCEIYGAYGWAEGLPMMKWLTDHMLVRGINEFVPHAFSPKFPDPDCPPHFYGGGHNPEFRQFRRLMDYMNRVSDLLSGGRHIADAAILYHAEAEWAGGQFMRLQEPAKALTLANIDFDIVPADYLAGAVATDGKLWIHQETFPYFIVPEAEYLPAATVRELGRMANGSATVLCLNTIPEKTVEGIPVTELLPPETIAKFRRCTLDTLAEAISRRDITVTGENLTELRHFHYVREDCHALFFTNEGIRQSVTAHIACRDYAGKEHILYDPMANTARRYRGEIALTLAPYEARMVLFGDLTGLEDITEAEEVTLSPVTRLTDFTIETAAPEDYDPADGYPQKGFDNAVSAPLHNIIRDNPRFAGFVKYDTALWLEPGNYVLDLGRVGETATLYVDEEPTGDAICPPYRFFLTIKQAHEVNLTVITTSHLGYAMRDRFSSYLAMEPVGLLGPVTLYRAD